MQRRHRAAIALGFSLVAAVLTGCPPTTTPPQTDPLAPSVAAGVLDQDVATALKTAPVDVLVSFGATAGTAAGAGLASGSTNPTASFVDGSTAVYNSFKDVLVSSAGVGPGAILDRYERLPELFLRVSTVDQMVNVANFRLDQDTGSGLVNTAVTRVTFPRDVEFEGMGEARDLVGLTPFITPPSGDPNVGAGSTIAVIDTGYDANAVQLLGVTPDVERSPIGTNTDGDQCHGTIVSYIASQSAPGAHIISYDISSGTTCFTPRISSTDGEKLILAALNDVILRRRNGEPIVAVNQSLGIPGVDCASIKASDPMGVVYDQLRLLGIVPVVASGNGGGVDFYPSCASSGAIRVGAVWDHTTTLDASLTGCPAAGATVQRDTLSCYSNRVSDDVLAPGGPFIDTPIPGVTAFLVGTSFATPMVAGAVAVLKYRHPTLAIDDLVAAVRDSGPLVTDTATGRRFHRLDIGSADSTATTIANSSSPRFETGRGGAFLPNNTGYLTISGGGRVVASVTGGARYFGDGHLAPTGNYVAILPTRTGLGYWTVDDQGHVKRYGDAPAVQDAFQRANGTSLVIPHVSPIAAATVVNDAAGVPSVLMVTKTGELLPKGFVPSGSTITARDALDDSDLATAPLDGDVVAITPTADGKGVWVTTAAGTVYSFGTAPDLPTAVGFRPAAPVVDMRVKPDATGYFLLAEDGTVTAIGRPSAPPAPSPAVFGNAAGTFAYDVAGRASSDQERAIGLSLDADLRSYRILTCTGRVVAVSLDANSNPHTVVTPPTQGSCSTPGTVRWPGHLAAPGTGNGFGTGINGSSADASLSGDGRYVAFASSASNLVAGDDDQFTDVFVWDRTTGQVTRQPTPLGAPDGPSGRPSISWSGDAVAFTSAASNLVVGDTNDAPDVFLWDLPTNTVTRVQSGSTQPDAASGGSTVADHGAYVAFTSVASNLVANDTNGVADVFRWTRSTGVVARAQRTGVQPDATSGGPGMATGTAPSISYDGNYVAFESNATNLVNGDSNGQSDVFRWVPSTSVVRRAAGDIGQQLTGSSRHAMLIPAGDWVAYDETNGASTEVGVWNVADGVRLASTPGALPRIASDGSVVAFESSNGLNLLDTFGGVLSVPSQFRAGMAPAFDVQGATVAFHSFANSSLPVSNIVVYNRTAGTFTALAPSP
ncbi:MAG: S8 family serine peptidase [Acidimicrobiales bacterium]